MIALVNYASDPGSVELRDVPNPSIGPHDVLLEVDSVGVCGSDLHMYMGKQSWPVKYPVILGHEFSGVISQVGSGVRQFKTGDRVVSETHAVIPEDSAYVRRGLYNLDPGRLGFGAMLDGAMTNYVCVPERCLHRVPDELSLETAALTEPCCVAYNATCLNSRISPGDKVAVIGPGPIGLLCAMFAKLAGAGHILVVGVPADAHRLSVAKEIGAEQVSAAPGEDIAREVRKLGDGYGCDLVIDAAGVSASLRLALEIVRPAGQITKVGWGPQPLNFSLDPLVQKAVTLQGSFSHNWPIWERVIELLARKKIDLGPILNRVKPLAEWKDAFDEMHSGQIIKAVLKP